MALSVASWSPDWEGSAPRIARQGEVVMALHQSVQHGVGDGGVSDPCMPMVDGQLAGDDGQSEAPAGAGECERAESACLAGGRGHQGAGGQFGCAA